MKILHLSFDGHGVDRYIPLFEHFYPNRNIWYISEIKKAPKRMNKYEAENVHWTKPWIDKIYLQEIAELSRNNIIERIVCHGCSSIYNEILELLFREKKYKVYWLFWGFELYRPLGYSGKKRMIDDESFWNPISYCQPTIYAQFFWSTIMRRGKSEDTLKKFLEYADYFCFWLYEDYLLLQKYYPNHAQFRHFQYGASWKGREKQGLTEKYFEKEPRTVMINHQASMFGNHTTILKKLKSLKGIDAFKITAPLSYGSRMVRLKTCWLGKRYFKDNFQPLVDYIPRDDYFNIVGKVGVAIFGQLRQEAAGNLVFLLANGTKIFMREESTLFQHYKKYGFIVFSFEKDLNSIDDLKELSLEEKRHNAKVYESYDNFYEDFMPKLLDD